VAVLVEELTKSVQVECNRFEEAERTLTTRHTPMLACREP